ncbi:MAG TPA: hypothetical protein VK249_18525 [Anaerolineales bacterium]|nr:hypothetical protein [Anaerolineales bacterium]
MDIVVKFLLDYIPRPHIFPGFILLLGWLIWLILKVCQWPRPNLSTMLIYTVSVGIALSLNLPRIRVCTALAGFCTNPLIWQRFLLDIAVWFIVVYLVMKSISRMDRNQAGKSGV